MWIKKKELQRLSDDIRKIIDGQEIDIRDNREGALSILKNDIHTLAALMREQVDTLGRERDAMSSNLTDISHQLKTPLTSMTIMADLLEESLRTPGNDELSDKQTEFLTNIKTSLTRMEWLVSALLKMAKLDAGAVAFTVEKVPAQELVALALEPLQILLDVKDQSIETDCGIVITCDKRWSAEALTNVLKNASDYSPQGSVIRLKSGSNPICSWISITDSGEGISKSDIPHLFMRFEGSRSDKGYGIGLPLALAIMRGQNGDIEVTPGTPAIFTLKFY